MAKRIAPTSLGPFVRRNCNYANKWSVGLHRVKGERKNQWTMTVNARGRICFEFRKGDAYEVEIIDYHKG